MNHNFPPQNNGNPFQPQQQQQPQPQKSNNTVLFTIIGLLVAIIVVGGLFFFVQSNNEEDSSTNAAETSETTESKSKDTDDASDSRSSDSRDPSAAFNVGDCLPESFGYSTSLVLAKDVVDCSSSEAVYELVEKSTEDKPVSCLDIPGVVNAVEDFSADERAAYCVVDKTQDPDTSINLAKVGDCVNLNDLSVDNIQKIDCSDRYAARISSVVDEAMPGLNESKDGGADIPEETIINFCRENGTPDPVGYYSLDFSFIEKDARTWCFSA